jgi:hypothetical protein
VRRFKVRFTPEAEEDEIESERTVTVLAVRHQREEDYH